MKLTGSAIVALAALVAVYVAWVNRAKLFAAVNPVNPSNVVNSAVTSAVQNITGDKNQTLGGLIYDTLHPNAGLANGETLLAPGIIKVQPVVAPELTPDDLIVGP